MKKQFILVILFLLVVGFAYHLYAADGDPVVEGTSPSFTGITMSPSATPGWEFQDSDDAAGTADIYGNSSGGSNDVIMSIGVEAGGSEDVSFIDIDGVSEQVEFKKNAVADKIFALTPQSLTVTTEANITLTGSLLLLTGDNDTDNDTIDLQDGTVTGQMLTIVGIALIDGDDTITVAMTDTTCTGCLTVLLDEIGDTWGLVWTGVTWATISNSEVP